jgi:hypothetical protein
MLYSHMIVEAKIWYTTARLDGGKAIRGRTQERSSETQNLKLVSLEFTCAKYNA